VIAIAPIFAVIVPTMPLVTVVPVAVAISEGDRPEIDLHDARTAITALISAGRLYPAVTAVTIVIPVVVNCAPLFAIRTIIVVVTPAIPMMVSVPITVAIADGDIPEAHLDADAPIVVIALCSCSTGRGKHCARESQRDDRGFQEYTHV
jgi:hypothetical protein